MMPFSRAVPMAASMFLVTLMASPAAAADELGLSTDGATWSSSIDTPLFDEAVRWVPGDERSSTFYVRNQGGTAGDLTVDVTSGRVGDLMASEDLRITARGGGGDWASVDEPGTRRLLSRPDIADGAVVPITVSVAFDATSTNTTQLQAATFRLTVNLAESAAEGGEDVDPGGLLPDTGAPSTWIVGVGALLVGVGAALANRRRDRAEVLADV